MTDIRCRDFVEQVTSFLDDGLDPAAATRFRKHLRLCPGCEHYLDQMRAVVRALRTL
jgi:anti-sigma factor RsiW